MTHGIWDNVLKSLEKRINKQSYVMWLKDTEPVAISGNTITIKVIDDVARRHITEQYLTQISAKIKEITGQTFNFEFITSNGFAHESVKTSNTNLSVNFNQVVDLVKQLPYKEKVKLGEVLRRETRTDISNDKVITHLASEKVLAKDWLSHQEDEAWKNL